MGFWRDFWLGPEVTNRDVTEQPIATAQAAPVQEVRSIATDFYARTEVTSVSATTALGIGAVYRAIQIIVTAASQMEMKVLRNGSEIPVPALVRQPNVNDTQSAFVQETVFSLAAHGNAYWRLDRSGPAEPVQNITVMNPDNVSVTEETLSNGNTVRRYYFSGVEMPAWRVKHLKLTRRPGHLLGYGPIQLAQKELLAAYDLYTYLENWFNVSKPPLGVLKVDRALNETESASLVKSWNEFIRKYQNVGVLPHGVTYEPIHVAPSEAQFLEVQQAMVTSIARIFGVPSTYMLTGVQGSSMTYSNAEDANLNFLQVTLTRYLDEIEGALSDLLPRGQRVQFNESQLLRLDATTRWSIAKTQVEIGYTNADELRKRDGLGPLPKPQTTTNDSTAPQDQESPSNGDS